MRVAAVRPSRTTACAFVFVGFISALTPASAQTNPAHSLAEKFSQAAEDSERKAAEAKRREAERKQAEAAAAAAVRRAEAERKAAAERAAYEEEMLARARAEAEERRALEAEAKRLAAKREAAERRQRAEAQRRAKEVEAKRLAAQREAAEKRQLAEAQRRAKEAEAKREAAEKRQRAEAQRRAKEAEAERLAAERDAAEKRQRAEAERRAKEAEAKRLAEQQEAREAEHKRQARVRLEAEREAEVRRVIEQFRLAREARRRNMPPNNSLGGPRPLIAKKPQVREDKVAVTPQRLRQPGRVTVLLVMEPRRSRSRGKRSGDPVLCVGKGCYISAGADDAADYFPRWKAMGPGIALGRRAGACRRQLTCVFRDIDFGGRTARIQPVDLGYLRHSRRRVQQVRQDGSCTVTDGQLHCAHTVVADTYRAWIVPEAIAREAGPDALSDALEEGLPVSQSAALADR